MYTKLILATLFSFALAAPQHQPAARYPAGVNPQDCPNFPLCDNARLHNPQPHWGAPATPAWGQPAAPAWNSPAAHAWQQPAPGQWNGHEDDGQYHHNSEWDRDTWSPHNNGAWNAPAPAWNAPAPAWNAPAPAWNAHAPAAQLPAGVSAHQCPNYPYCH